MKNPISITIFVARAIICLLPIALIVFLSDTSHNTSKAMNAKVEPKTEINTFATKGKFSAVQNWPGDTPPLIHASMLPNGRILFWGRDKATTPFGGQTTDDVINRSSARVWDPATNTFQTVNNSTTNLFCSGHSLLADGRLFVAGGHANPAWNSRAGDDATNLFNYAAPPASNSYWEAGPTMSKGRWYPFTVTLENGKVAIVSGSYQESDGSFITQLQPETYDPQTNHLTLHNPLDDFLKLYPYLFLDPRAPDMNNPDRGVFIAGPSRYMFWNPNGGADGQGSVSAGTLPHQHYDGTAVMYNSEAGNILLIGGRQLSNSAPTNNVSTITLNQENPVWTSAPTMRHPRAYHTSTILPDGNVLVTNGIPCRSTYTHEPCLNSLNQPISIDSTLEAEMWKPNQTGGGGVWETMAKSSVVRGYHSTAMLLPDATVLVGGHGLPDGMKLVDNNDPNTIRRHNYAERNIEIYSPPYLFDAAGNAKSRPVINSTAAAVGYGQQFALSYSRAINIKRVAWVRLPSVTHGFNADQRINVLEHSLLIKNQLAVKAPSDPRKCPPGYYMLFIFDQNDTPSVAKIININHQQSPGANQEDYIGRRAIKSNDRVHVFYRHSGDIKLKYMAQDAMDSNTFNSPVDLGGALNSNPLAIQNADGRLEVFVLGTDNKFYSRRQNAVGSDIWSDWQLLGPSSSLPTFAVSRNLNGRIQIFFRGTDNAVRYITQTAANSTTWTAETLLGAPVTSSGSFIPSEPSVGINSDGRLEVFVRGSDNALYHKYQTAPGSSSWSNWISRGGVLTSAPFVAYHLNKRFDVFVRGADSAVHHITQTMPNGLTWSAWENLGGQVRADHAYVTPVAMLTPNGHLQVFVRWADDTLRTLVQNTPDGSFSVGAWSNLWGSVNATLPPPALSNDGRFFIFLRGFNTTNLYVNRQSIANSPIQWDGFFYMGDSVQSF